MFRNWSIAWRLGGSMLLASLVILGAVIGYGYGIARQILEQELEAKAWQLSRAVTARIESVEVAVRKTVDGMGGRMAIDAPKRPETPGNVVSAAGTLGARQRGNLWRIDRVGTQGLRIQRDLRLALCLPFLEPTGPGRPRKTRRPLFRAGLVHHSPSDATTALE